mmetsp:Transcript_157956/g.484091  ORF Transcript_157956/g.484091 Transcript_157956/m.484091 type:complete len:99 (-) Transcript_157956:171-467(-)
MLWFSSRLLTSMTRSWDARLGLPPISGRRHLFYTGVLGVNLQRTYDTESEALDALDQQSWLWAYAACDDLGRAVASSGVLPPSPASMRDCLRATAQAA